MRRIKALRTVLVGSAVGVGLWGLLATNTALRRDDATLTNLGSSRRYWEDTAIATINLQVGCLGCQTGPWGWTGERVRKKLKQILPRNARRARLKTWQFWRTVKIRRLQDIQPTGLRESDDVGRSFFTTVGFMALGGVAPYLPLWLAVLLALPLFAWLMVECALARCPLVGVVTLGLWSLSIYTVEALTLAYSAVGFHLVGLLLIPILGVHGLLGKRPSAKALLGRWALAGVIFMICALCRGSVRALVFSLAMLALLSAWRSAATARRRFGHTLLAAGLMIGVLVSPYLLIRPPQRHEAWVGIWEGLGDFDRSKGHAWSDTAAREALRGEGIAVTARRPGWTAEMESTFRRLVTRDIVGDPVWYGGILARRVAATLLQLKLWPRSAVDGAAFARHTHPGEGAMDEYYRLTTTADVFGLGRWAWEAPLPLLWAGPLLFASVIAVSVASGRLSGARAVSYLTLVALVGVGAGAVPVIVSTAAGPETQAFVLVYFLSAGVGIHVLLSAHSRAGSPRAPKGSRADAPIDTPADPDSREPSETLRRIGCRRCCKQEGYALSLSRRCRV